LFPDALPTGYHLPRPTFHRHFVVPLFTTTVCTFYGTTDTVTVVHHHYLENVYRLPSRYLWYTLFTFPYRFGFCLFHLQIQFIPAFVHYRGTCTTYRSPHRTLLRPLPFCHYHHGTALPPPAVFTVTVLFCYLFLLDFLFPACCSTHYHHLLPLIRPDTMLHYIELTTGSLPTVYVFLHGFYWIVLPLFRSTVTHLIHFSSTFTRYR